MTNVLKTISKPILVAIMSLIMFIGVAVPVYAQDIPEGDKIGWLFLILIILAVPEILGWSALALIWRGLFPRRLNWTSSIVRKLSWSSFWFGLLSFIILMVIGALLAQAGEGAAIILIILVGAYLFMFASFGKIAVIEWAGEVVDPTSTGMRRAMTGVTALYVLLFIPFVGWLLLLGLAFMGIGAAIYSWFPTRPPEQPASPTIQQPPAE